MDDDKSIIEEDEDTQKDKYLTFGLAEETYGIDIAVVIEIIGIQTITNVPEVPEYVRGIINLRGNVVTVIDTRARFGIPPAEVTDNTRIMIIESEKHVIGILVDSVAEVADLNTADIDDTPNVGTEENAQFISGVCNRKDDLLILIDLTKLFTETEWKEVTNLG